MGSNRHDIGTGDVVKRNLIMKITDDVKARKGRKRIVLKARQSSEIEEHGYGVIDVPIITI